MRKTRAWGRRLSLVAATVGALALTPLGPVALAAEASAPADTHVSYYSFDEDATTDQWGSRNGTITGDVPLVDGKVGKAVKITPDNHISYPALDLPHNWSIGFWVKAPTATGRASILQSTDGVRAISQRLAAERPDKIGFHVLAGSGGVLTYGHTLENEKWTHITATNSSTEGIALYVNGDLLELKNWGVSNPVAVPSDILGGEGFTGLVDELKIYNRALTASEVRSEIQGLEEEESQKIPTLKARFDISNMNEAPFQVGKVIRYNLTVTNDTDKTRSFMATASNLENWAGCKWTSFPTGASKSCPFPTHTVTAEDVKRGSFTPSITFQYFENTGYSGQTTAFAPFEGVPTQVEAKLAQIESFIFTGGTGKDNYSQGDTLTATLVVKNPTDADISMTAGDACTTTISAGRSHTCTLSYAITKEDLERGEARFDVVVKVRQDGKESQEAARATTSTPMKRPAATAFDAANANPKLGAKLGTMQVLGTNTGGYNIRIPAIAVASNGDILASYDQRPTNGAWKGGDSPNENSIVQRRSTDGGKTWGPVTVIAQGKVAGPGQRYGWSDPSYVVDHMTGEIFNFHVGSLDAGLPNQPGYRLVGGKIDETYRKTMNFALSSSTDNGYTWSSRIITNDVLGTRAAKVDGCFATSGAGIQKMHEPHKGRLLQQAACRFIGAGFRAITIYSDDHGKTWHGGEFASATEGAPSGQGWFFDENKVVELSDGRLMLNSRVAQGFAKGYRIVATSEDGGVNWKNIHVDKQLVDATNNAQIIRAFPSAEKGTLRSKVLLFSNTERGRQNGTVKMSYDDGQTWPVSRQIRYGGTGYTTMAVQPDGSIGLLMEPDIWNKVGYVNFTLQYVTKNLPFELSLDPITDMTGEDGKAITPITLKSSGNDPKLGDTYTVEGLPTGLSFNKESGTIEGTPKVGNTEQQSFKVTATITEADDGTGVPRTSSQTFTIALSPKPLTEVTPQAPAFDKTSGVITLPALEGVAYMVNGKAVTGTVTVEPGKTMKVTAQAMSGYKFSASAEASWEFTADLPAQPEKPEPSEPGTEPSEPSKPETPQVSLGGVDDRGGAKIGGTITISATGFTAGGQVHVFLHSDPVLIGQVTADEKGAVRFSYTIPASIPAGEHKVVLKDMKNGMSVSSPLLIETAPDLALVPESGKTLSSVPESGKLSGFSGSLRSSLGSGGKLESRFGRGLAVSGGAVGGVLGLAGVLAVGGVCVVLCVCRRR